MQARDEPSPLVWYPARTRLGAAAAIAHAYTSGHADALNELMTNLVPLHHNDRPGLDANERAAANLLADTTAWLSAADPATFGSASTISPDEQLCGGADEASNSMSSVDKLLASIRACSDAGTSSSAAQTTVEDCRASADSLADAAPADQVVAVSTDAAIAESGGSTSTAHAAVLEATAAGAAPTDTTSDADSDTDSAWPAEALAISGQSADVSENTASATSADTQLSDTVEPLQKVRQFLANPEDFQPCELTYELFVAWCAIWQPADVRFLRAWTSLPTRPTVPIDPVNLRDPGTGATALIAAARLGCVDTVKALVRRGADCEARDNTARSAADWAQKCGHADVLTALAAAPGVQTAEEYMFDSNTADADLIYELLCQICGESDGAGWTKPEVRIPLGSSSVCRSSPCCP